MMDDFPEQQSTMSQKEVLAAALEQTGNLRPDIYSPFQYAWFTMMYFMIVWFASVLARKCLASIKRRDIASKFEELSEDKRRNAITYIIQFFMTTLVFFCQVWGSFDVLFRFQETTTQEQMNWMVFSLESICVLYIWELIYREKIGWPLLLHHFVTILLIQTAYSSFVETGNILYLRFMILEGFYATTEQLSFVALFVFRMDIIQEWQSFLFLVAAGQTFLIKTLVSLVCLLYFCVATYGKGVLDDDRSNWGLYWKIMYVPLLVLLTFAQSYASYILWVLYKRCLKKSYTESEADTSESTSKTVDTEADALGMQENDLEMGKSDVQTERKSETILL